MADYKAIKGQTIQNRTSDPLVAGVLMVLGPLVEI